MTTRTLLLTTLLAVCRLLPATSYIPPRDLAQLAAESHAVVMAEAGESVSEPRGGLCYTTTDFLVLEALAGPLRPDDVARIETPGGEFDGVAWRVAGSPRFQTGESCLLFLHRKTDELWITSMLAYGLLRETPGTDGTALLVPLDEIADAHAVARLDGDAAEPVVPYRRDALLEHLRLVLSGRTNWDLEAVRAGPEPLIAGELPRRTKADPPAGCTFFNSDGRNWRQPAFDSHGTLTVYANAEGDPSITGGGFRLIQEGLDLWMDISGTSCNLLFGGARSIVPSCGGHADFILFDDPCSDIADLSNCGGVLAFGGGAGGGTHRYGGESWITMSNWFVVVNNGVGCMGTGNCRILLAHELGHGLGFGHFEDSSSLMWGTCCHAINGTDRSCARYAYAASDAANTRPTADAGPNRTLRLLGDTVRLAGTAGDDGRPTGGRLTTTWRHLVGPDRVLFSDASALDTIVTFPASGTYLLGLVAHDGELLRMDQVEIEVEIFAGGGDAVALQEGVDGYRGTADTALVESAPTSDQSQSTELGVDGDHPSGTGREVQTLLRFDGIFGTDAGQIPPGVPIGRAWLELTSTDGGNGATLHRLKADWSDTTTWRDFGGDGIQAGLEALDEPDAIIVDPGNGLARIDVTASLAAWSQQPCANHGWVFIPRGGNGWDFYSAEGDEPPRLVVEPARLGGERMIALGDTWDYFKGTQAPPVTWKNVDFSPGAGWLSGPSGFGYGDDDDATVLDDMPDGYPSVFCRRRFFCAGSVAGLTLRIDYDDGFVAYINGVEAARSPTMGAAGSTVRWNTLASDHEAGTFEDFALDADILRAGWNVLAVEVHNTSIGSSDCSLRPELVANYQLLPGNSTWRFLRGSQSLPADWNQPAFDDRAWESGRTSIGYGDNDDLTELTDMEDSYLTVFARTTFTLADPDAGGPLLVTMIYDDGVVVYLNGTEVGRANMPGGAAGRTTAASTLIEPEAAVFSLPAERLVTGQNLLAVSVHNATLSSSDLSFDAALAVGSRVRGCSTPFRRGDIDSDGTVTIGDPIALLGGMFAGAARSPCRESEDANNDGAVDIADVIYVLTYLFGGGDNPPAPGPNACGPDPDSPGSPGDLGCERYDGPGC